jgi:hypothetical protein
VIGALLGLVLGGASLLGLALVPSAAAQVTASPAALEVGVPAGQAAEVALTVSNGSAEVQPIAIALAPADVPDDGTTPGDVLSTSEPLFSSVADLTMTPDGRIFVAKVAGFRVTTELTAELEYVRTFEHPTTDLLSGSVGLAYSGDTGPGDDGSLWWMDIQPEGPGVEQALLIEGDFDGEPTGRQLAFPFGEGGICGNTVGYPVYLAYDRSGGGVEGGVEGEGRFYYLDVHDDTVWAADTLGAAAPGYPVAFSDYAGIPRPPQNPEGCLINAGLDAHTLSADNGPSGAPLPAEPLLEGLLGYPYVHPFNRAYAAVVLDGQGRNRGAETPLFELPPPEGVDGAVLMISGVVRSRLDPSVLYVTAVAGTSGTNSDDFVYAVRAAPLPPVWLRAEEILFEVEPESERELALVLDATGLEPGVYEGVVAVRAGDGIGPVVAEVPVALTVTPATDAEGDPEGDAAPAAFRLSAYPNPSGGEATVALSLRERAEVRVALYDVLGREVATLADGVLAAGRHVLTLDGSVLPAGVYLVQATSGARVHTHRITVVR